MISCFCVENDVWISFDIPYEMIFSLTCTKHVLNFVLIHLMSVVLFSSHLEENKNNKKKGKCNEPIGNSEKWYYKIPPFIYICFWRLSFWFYFLIMMLQIVYTTSLDIRITLLPIIMSIVTSIVLDITQKKRQQKYINKINDNTTKRLNKGKWTEVKWKDLQPGDIIQLTDRDFAPADCVVLKTSNGHPISVETNIIDGSTQLGPRNPPDLPDIYFENAIEHTPFTIRDIQRERFTDPTQAKSQLTSKYNFTAKLDFGSKSCELSNKNFVERYSAVYHNGAIVCGIIFTGKDCWSVKNAPTRIKFTHLERKLNLLNIFLIALIVIASLICALISLAFYSRREMFPIYSEISANIPYMSKSSYFLSVWRNYIVLLIPVSPLELYAFMDLVFLANSLLIMRSFKKSSIPNTRIIDEMSNVDAVITSKSMLLAHKPTLKRVFLNGVSYGQDITTKKLSQNIENDLLQNRTIMRSFYDPSLKASDDNRMFFLHSTLCHSATLVGNSEKFNYVSRFPDDEHLLKLAASCGFMLTGRTETESYVLVGDQTYHFKTKRIIHSSLRHPRISIIVEDSEGQLILLTRGVYKVMINLVDDLERDYQSQYDLYHQEGLHVECSSYKYLTQKQYMQFEEKLAEFGEENIDFEFSVVEELEKHSIFLAMLGFEDQPRDGTLLFLARAKGGLNHIVLSSQSKGTSLVITAIALGIIHDDPLVGTIKGNIVEDVEISISYVLEAEKYDALIITGSSIEFLLQSEYAHEVADLIHNTKLIILQRCDQLQASQFIEYLQKVNKETVLAVGHTIYDSVYMQKADVSVAITEENIHPCTVSSDIVINSFDNLCDLIFVQGTWVRERVRSFINYIMPRNMFVAFIQMWYGIFCCFSGTPLIEESNLLALLYFFTIAPYLSRSLFNEKVHQFKLLSSATFFKEDNVNNLNKNRFIISLGGTLVSSLILLLISYIVLFNTRTEFTDTISLPHFSHQICTSILFACLGFVLPLMDTWCFIQHFIVWGSQILFFTLYRIITEFDISGQMEGTTNEVFTKWPSICILALSLFVSLFASSSYIMFKKIRQQRGNLKKHEIVTESQTQERFTDS